MDKVYRDFSISVGVKNIREYEERQLKDAQALQERKLTLNTQMSKLKYQYVKVTQLPSTKFCFDCTNSFEYIQHLVPQA